MKTGTRREYPAFDHNGAHVAAYAFSPDIALVGAKIHLLYRIDERGRGRFEVESSEPARKRTAYNNVTHTYEGTATITAIYSRPSDPRMVVWCDRDVRV